MSFLGSVARFVTTLAITNLRGSGWGLVAPFIANALFPEQQRGEADKLSNLTFSGSSYGAVIPKIWGTARVGALVQDLYKYPDGNHIKETIQEREKNPDEYDYTCSGFMSFCDASLWFPDNDHALGGTILHRGTFIRRIIANDTEVIYETDASGVVTHNPYGFICVSGTETQTANSSLATLHGMGSNMPAYVGQCGAWFVNWNIDKWGTIPKLSADIQTNAVECGDVLSDICRMHGLKPSQFDVTECYNTRMPGGAGMTLRGFVWRDVSDARSAINQICSVYDIDAVEVDGKIKFLPRASASAFSIDEMLLGATTGDPGSAPKLTRRKKMYLQRPRAFQIRFIDPDNNYEPNQVDAVYKAEFEGSDYTMSTSIVLKADEAQKVIMRTRDRFWAEYDEASITLPMQGIQYAPGDVLSVTSDGQTCKFRVEKMGLGVGVIPISGTIVDDDVIIQIGSSPPGPGTSAPPTIYPSTFFTFSGTEALDEHRVTPGLYVAATGPEGWRSAQVWYKLSTSAEYIPGPTITTRAVFGQTTSVLSDSGAVAGAWDYTNTVDVAIDAACLGTLGPLEESAVESGAGHAWVGQEILGIATPTLTGANLYTLSDLLRGQVASPMTGHASGERFVLATSAIAHVGVPEAHVGLIYDVKVVSVGQSLGDVTAQQVTIVARTPSVTEQKLAQVLSPVWIAPSDITSLFTFDNTWRTITSLSGVPSGAEAIMLFIEYNNSTGSSTKVRFEVRRNSSSDSYRLAASSSGAGGDTTSVGHQATAPVMNVFDYRAPSGWIEKIELVGYLITPS